MKQRSIEILSVGSFLTFMAVIGAATCSCDQTPSSPPGAGSTSTPSASIVVTNNTAYPVSMGMDGGTLVSVPVSGGSHIFKATTAGVHTFAGTSTYDYRVNGTDYCRGVTTSCSSSSLSLNNDYSIVITATTTYVFCYGVWDYAPGPDWSCP